MKRPVEIGTDGTNKQQGHLCLKCGQQLGENAMFRFITSIGTADIRCSSCRQVHEFDDEKPKFVNTLIFYSVFCIFFVITGTIFILDAKASGGVLVMIFVLPVIVGVVAGTFASKIYKWKTGRLVLFGH